MHMDWKDTMETPDGNGKEQGSDMVADHNSSNTEKVTTGVKTLNSTSQNPETPREGCGNRRPRTMIWESLYGVGLYGLGNSPMKGKPALSRTDDVAQNEAPDINTSLAQSCSINGEKSSSTSTVSVLEGNKTANDSGDTLLEPPVTKEVLAELEIAMVISNPKFRHDFNFGCKIPYVPKRRKQKSDEFWRTLQLQISELWSDREAFIAKHPGNTWTLPLLLKAIGEILTELLPQRDSSLIEETLDVDLLMQQLTKGQLNLGQLADFFSETLRKHCTPERDCDVFEMAKQLTTGFRSGNVDILVDGLVQLLTTIEAMRLDVTNHQINHLTLIQSFVSFQQTNFLRMIPTGDIDIYESYAWFDSYRIPDEITALCREWGIWKFFRAFVDLLRHSNREAPIPDTLQLDNERIADLRMKLLSAVNIHVCMTFFNIIDQTVISPKISASEGRIHASSQLHSDSNTIEHNRRVDHVRSTLHAIVDDYSNPDIDSSPPPTSSPLDFDPWKVAAPSLALEMLRKANGSLSNPYFEKSFIASLSNLSNPVFKESERVIVAQLGELVQEYVDAWQPLDSVALYKVAPVCPRGCKMHGKSIEFEPLDEIARVIAYLGFCTGMFGERSCTWLIPTSTPTTRVR
ncbi:hypothetical protein VC83_03813 [Pseudogymnoascus destructans]|uniref:T-complex 11 n=2 Tax=Pseudogymnoascus destructans TaxID=655981 RepID=L8FV59_PSED2|nr:uncharacterized protein VC83_03813 [Pseudogymnoascus destructans]ELR03601.1 hypothetical protein GMDG_06255 [Pseudogymnoascus destructans 20631-21]OAF59807.1 hypothetical protein VC83_03813 [Pseudogymnoascus destructans]